MKKLVLFGNGDHASLCHYRITHETDYSVVAFTVDRPYMKEATLHGLPVVPWDEVALCYPPAEHEMLVTIGHVQVNELRAARYREARELGYRVASFVSPHARLWDGFPIGDNCIFHGNVEIQPYAHVGHNVNIGSGSIIGHNSTVGDHCFLSAGVLMAGNVTVGSHCFIGIGAVIRDNVVIAPSCIIGAGAVILSDIVEHGVYMTKPAYKLPAALPVEYPQFR
jgi:sugar O-acyltransferase (sialic acid O-acetyltransferase NeuD family)